MGVEFGLAAIVTIFAINNPIGNVPFFVALTEDLSDDVKRRVINKACLVTLVTLLVFGAFGDLIFDLYGITIPAFRIAGGILLFTVSLTMMQGRRPRTKITERERDEALEEEQIGIVPLGIPMSAGPGTITTVMILVTQVSDTGDMMDYAWIVAGIVIAVIVMYILLSNADRVFGRIGRTGTMAFSRIMGMILAAVSVQFILDGIFNAVEASGLF